MAGLFNKDVAGVFREIEVLLRVVEGDAQRARNYGRISRILETLPQSAANLAAAGRLTEIRGLGPATQRAVAELVDTGTIRLRDELAARAPKGLLDMLRIPGFGPGRIFTACRELGIETIEELREAAMDGRLGALKGFGAKTAQKVLEGIAFVERVRGSALLSQADALARNVIETLGLENAVACGALRRSATVVEEIPIVATGTGDGLDLPGAMRDGDTWTLAPGGGPKITIRLVPQAGHALAVFRATGPSGHVDAVLARPGRHGSEEEIYASRELHFVPPERRHACDGSRPVPTLIESRDVKGVLHAHTTWSDGKLDLPSMAEAAAARGYSWLGVADHSRSAAYANGLSIERLRAQAEEIATYNAAGGAVRVLHGSEVDILPDGALDFPDDVLEALDFVIASVHSSFGQDAQTVTDRIVRAVRHPRVTVLGHPTGRLLLRRAGYPVDMERVLAAAAEAGTMVELNANPWRLDLDPGLHARAAELGIPVPICPDAHSAAGIDDLAWGVRAARHGGLRAEDVATTRDADEFLEIA